MNESSHIFLTVRLINIVFVFQTTTTQNITSTNVDQALSSIFTQQPSRCFGLRGSARRQWYIYLITDLVL